MDSLNEALHDIAHLWGDWRRKPGEPLSLAKVAGVVAALYAYQRITPNTSWDKLALGVAAIGATVGATVPSHDEVEELRSKFSINLVRSLVKKPDTDEALRWFEGLSRIDEVALAEVFRNDAMDDVAAVISNKDNRDKIERAFQTIRAAAGNDSSPTNVTNQTQLKTIDKEATLVSKGLGSLAAGLLFGAGGVRCAVKTPFFEIQTPQGKVKIPTAVIKLVSIRDYHRHFRTSSSGLDARVITVDGSEYSGRLLTTRIQVEPTGAIQFEAKTVDCSTLSAISALSPVFK